MLRIAQTIVRARRAVIAVTALLVIAGIWGMMNNRVNYDLLSYLPQDLDSVQGLEIVDDEFALGTMVQIMVYGESDVTVDTLTKRIREVEGVKAVHWVTDLAPITQPGEFRDEEVVSNYYAEGGTLLQVAFDGSANDPHVKEAIGQIRDVLDGYDALLTGNQQLELEEVIGQERVRFTIAVLVLVTIVLLLTIPSVIVPLLFVLTIGVGGGAQSGAVALPRPGDVVHHGRHRFRAAVRGHDGLRPVPVPPVRGRAPPLRVRGSDGHRGGRHGQVRLGCGPHHMRGLFGR